MTTRNTTHALPAGWRETTLGEVAEILSGSTPSTKEPAYWDGCIPWITPKDLSNFHGVAIKNGERNISAAGVENSSAQILPQNTVLFSSRAPIGYVTIAGVPLTTNQGFKNVVCDEKNTHYKYAYYWLKANVGRIEKLSSGSTFPEASASLMRSLKITLPPFPEQRAIADMLSCLDNKIELLRRQNDTLETMARTVWQERFGRYSPERPEELPEGWRVGRLTEVATFLNGLALQNFRPKQGEDSLPVIKIRELKAGITEQTEQASTSIDRKYIVEDGDVLFSWSGSLELVLWQHGKWALNQHLFRVSSEEYPKWFYYLWIQHHLPHFRALAQAKATTMGHIQRHHLEDALVLIPDQESFRIAHAIFAPVLEKVFANKSQTQALSALRDTLLPRVMSGTIKHNTI